MTPQEGDRHVKVLLVEDDPDSAFLISLHLSEACGDSVRFTLQTAESLAGGLDCLAREDYDAILLDLMLPDSRGLKTLEGVRDKAADIPIVILTGLSDEEIGFDAVAQGAQDYLVKESLDPRRLRRALAYALERSRLSRRLIELERLQAELQRRRQVEEFKDQVISSVSHELRSPLTVVKAAIANLWDGLAGPLSEPQAQLVYIALRNTHRLNRLIENFLDLSRLEAGKIQAHPQALDARRLAKETVEGLRLAFGAEKRHDIRLDLPEDLPSLHADPDLFQQVLNNLLDNALRYARSWVSVRARPIEGGSEVRFTVSDDGPGIPPERLGDLFNKFVQVNRPPAGGGYKGTGLGLALCKELVAMNGGRIWAESPSGEGGVFHFTMPCRPPKAAAEKSDESGKLQARAHR